MFNCNTNDPRTMLQRRLDGDRARVRDDSTSDPSCGDSPQNTTANDGCMFGSSTSSCGSTKRGGMFVDPPAK